MAAFTRLSPARHAARRLLAAGPVVGGCWAAALITGRAWTWPVPATVRLLYRCSTDHCDWLARRRSVRTAVPISPPRRSRGMRRHHRARQCHAHRCRPRHPGLGLASDPCRRGQHRPPHLHRPGSARRPDGLRTRPSSAGNAKHTHAPRVAQIPAENLGSCAAVAVAREGESPARTRVRHLPAIPVAVLCCCTPGRRCGTAPSRSSLGATPSERPSAGRTVPQAGRRERTRHYRHQRARRKLKSGAPSDQITFSPHCQSGHIPGPGRAEQQPWDGSPRRS